MNKTSLDIVIPSYRADALFLEKIFQLSYPEYLDISFVLVIDNPEISISSKLEELIETHNIRMIINSVNLGAGGARNVGIENGSNEWIIFLDDDIYPEENLLYIYGETLLEADKSAIGYFGVTKFPSPVNSFTKGIIASDILTFFPIAENVEELSWGVTANLIIRRSSLGNFRFQDIFPKFGGGEDIDLCLQIVNITGQQFRAVPEAIVHHPWWMDGKRDYTRFMRWAYGDSRLPRIHPEHKYHNAPNVIETLFIAIIFLIIYGLVSGNYQPLIVGVIGIILGEYLGEYTKLVARGKTKSPIVALESALIRGSNDFGRLKGNLLRGHLLGISERFDYFCNGEHIRGERIWAIIKQLLYITISLTLVVIWTQF